MNGSTFLKLAVVSLSLLLGGLLLAGVSYADEGATEPVPGGRLEVIDSGVVHLLPTVRSDYSVNIAGDLATITLEQEFRNNLGAPVNATYLFPLNKDAAVHAMTMEVADEVVRAVIKRKEDAKKTFNKAKAQGKSAVLLEQHRPNMFTQRVANLAPDAPITVTLEFVMPVTRVDGEYELVLPLVVGPRYSNRSVQRASARNDDANVTPGTWQLEALPRPTAFMTESAPEDLRERVSINIELDGGLPVADVRSATHQIVSRFVTESVRTISLNDERVVDNRDFVLRYSLRSDEPAAAFLSHTDDRGGYFSLLIEPPANVQPHEITPREMVFVLDCSGSMSGPPLAASKQFMRKALRTLRPTDTFRIIRFSERATEFSSAPLPATPQNIAAGLRYTESLNGSGGTEMITGIKQALDVPVPAGSIRLVTFLTDGFIGAESTVLTAIKQRIGAARLFALGVGTSTNRYLLSEMGTLGRGFVMYLDPTGDAETVTTTLAERLRAPVLTDIHIDWGNVAVSDVFPRKIPDLFAGQSVRVQGRYTGSGEHRFKVRGEVAGKPAELVVTAGLDGGAEHEALPVIWARSAIADRMREYSSSGRGQIDESIIREQVTSLGLLYNLVTRWTSFVAVSERRYNNAPGRTPDLDVPRNQVAGTRAAAYGQGQQFVGHGAPEPGTILAILSLFAMLLWMFGGDRGNWRSGFARNWQFDLKLSADASLDTATRTNLSRAENGDSSRH